MSANQNSKMGRSGLEPSTSTVFRAELKSEIVTQACGFLFIRSNPPATFRVTTKLSNAANVTHCGRLTTTCRSQGGALVLAQGIEP